MASDAERIRQAAAKYGRQLDSVASRYVNPINGKPLSGESLILKTVELESNALSNPEGARSAVSSAGARKWAQFMPGTRAAMIKRFGIDPWASPEQAVQGLVLHQRGKLGNALGLEGYNPGDPNYPAQVLATKIGKTRGRSAIAAGLEAPAPNGQASAFDPGTAEAPGIIPRNISQAPPAGSLPPPAFSAGVTLPRGYTAPSPAPPVAPQEPSVGMGGASEPPTFGEPQQGAGAYAPTKAQGGELDKVLSELDRVDRAKVPYQWGGGHAGKQIRGTKVTPLDCSGAVSRALGIDPRVAAEFKGWGRPGHAGDQGVTVYARDDHVLLGVTVNGRERFWGTSRSNPGGGPGWIPSSAISKGYLARFTARHSERLGG